MKTGIELIAIERQEQIEKHGYDVKSDSGYENEELINAAYAYMIAEKEYWPWENNWKPTDRISNLKKAGAFIAAEIDRLQNS